MNLAFAAALPQTAPRISGLEKICPVGADVRQGARVGAGQDRKWKHIDFRRGTIDLRLDDGVTRKGRAIVPLIDMARTALEEA